LIPQPGLKKLANETSRSHLSVFLEKSSRIHYGRSEKETNNLKQVSAEPKQFGSAFDETDTNDKTNKK
jgi:hypothetical protein